MKSHSLALLGGSIVMLLLLLALLAPLLAPFDYDFQNLSQRLMPPDRNHLFGTDELGRDIFSRVLYGSRISMFVGVSVVGFASGIGLFVGILAEFYGGWVDEVLMRAADVLMAFPGILLAIALVAFWGSECRLPFPAGAPC